MKKTLILAGMLSVGYANAQKGQVGVNTQQPRATLEVAVLDASKSDNSNQGVLIPNLTKTRVASIASPVESTLVYINDINYTGNDAKVSDVVEKGFYYYNGTKWIRTQGPKGDTGGIGLIVNGTNTTVTGSGTTDAPYKINVTATGETATSSFTRNIRVEPNNTTTIKDNDYFIHLTSTAISTLTLPDANAASKGRVLCFYNENGPTITVTPQPKGAVQGVQSSQTACFISNGVDSWVSATGY